MSFAPRHIKLTQQVRPKSDSYAHITPRRWKLHRLFADSAGALSWRIRDIRLDGDGLINSLFERVVAFSDIRAIVLGRVTESLKSVTPCVSEHRYFSIIKCDGTPIDFESHSIRDREEIVCAVLDRMDGLSQEEVDSVKNQVREMTGNKKFGIAVQAQAQQQYHHEPVEPRQRQQSLKEQQRVGGEFASEYFPKSINDAVTPPVRGPFQECDKKCNNENCWNCKWVQAEALKEAMLQESYQKWQRINEISPMQLIDCIDEEQAQPCREHFR